MKFLFSLFILVCLNTKNVFSQSVNLGEIKYTLYGKFDNLELDKIIDLIENYKNDEIEILTLEMEKLGRTDRSISGRKIFFGKESWDNKIELRHLYTNPPQYKIGDLYFTKNQSPKVNDKFKIYYTLNIYIDKKSLYNSIIEIGNKDEYKLISSKIINGGILKVFEFIPIDKRKGFLIQTLDGDEISKISFMLSY